MNSSDVAVAIPPSLPRLFASFLRLGTTAFGGPAMVAYIRKMAVEQNHWLDDASFQDGVALCLTIPGATAMQTAAYVGLRSRGIAGAAACFVGFGLPAFCFMAGLSAVYARTYDLPLVLAAFQSLRAMTVAIVANAALTFGKRSLRGPADIIIDMNCCRDEHVLETHQPQVERAREEFERLFNLAIFYIGEAKQYHDAMERFYAPNMDFAGIERLRKRITQRILGYAQEVRGSEAEGASR